MIRPHLIAGLIAVAALTAASPLGAQTMSLVLPSGFDLTDGQTGTNFPQNDPRDQKWQWHFDSSNFGVTFPIIISEVSVRAASPGAMVSAFNFPSWEVTLAEASTHHQMTPEGGVPGHDPVFANNIQRSASVRTGPWSGGPVFPSGATTASWIPMGLTGTFAYDPTLGNDFIIQIEKCGDFNPWGTMMDMAVGSSPRLGTRWGHQSDCRAVRHDFTNVDLVPVVKIDFVPATAFADDLRVFSIDTPNRPTTGCGVLGSSEPVTITLQNFGTNTIPAGTAIPVSYTFDRGAGPPVAVTETYRPAAPLLPLALESFTFARTVDVSQPAVYLFEATARLPGDLDPTNDRRSGHVVASGGLVRIVDFPYLETFDGVFNDETTLPPPGWEQDPLDASGFQSDWIFRNRPTPTSGTGPNADHTTGVPRAGFYTYVEDAGDFAGVNLISPCIDLRQSSRPRLKFWVHSNNTASPTTLFENFLSVDVIRYPARTITTDVRAPIGHVGSDWELRLADLSAFAGSVVQIRFRASSDGGGTAHDLAIDDVEIFEDRPGMGQAPRPGLALMDINDSVNGSGLPVAQAGPGPYYATAEIGDQLTFTFEGEASQPVVVLLGILNPALTVFPGIGQLDIGDSIDPVTGFPTGVDILIDGTRPSGFGAFFNTGPLGRSTVGFTLPAVPRGVLATFQAAIFNTGPQVLGLTNAIELTVP